MRKKEKISINLVGNMQHFLLKIIRGNKYFSFYGANVYKE